MRAARIYEYGAADVFRIEDDVPRPAVGPRDVLIEIHAAAVNPIDWKIRQGSQRAFIRYKLPHVLGLDASGVVVEVGGQVKRFKVGDEVYTSPTHRRSGCYAEYTAVDERQVALKPKSVSHEEAAGIPLAGLTAWQSLVDDADLQRGERVLIQAGAGGVGSLAIQMAKHLGAYVATTCSERNIELVTQLGADQVVNYREEAFDEVLSDYHVVLDALGGESKERALTILAPGGRLVSIVSGIPAYVKKHGALLGVMVAMFGLLRFKIRARLKGIRASMVLKRNDGEQLQKLSDMIDEAAIKPLVDKVYPLDELAEAHRYSESGRARGKIIIAIRS